MSNIELVKNLRLLVSYLISIYLCVLLSGCDRPSPDYPLDTDNTRIVESPGLNEPSQSANFSTSNSLIFSPLGFQKKGYFIDSAVSGLQYSSLSQHGITGTDGSFQYTEGEIVRFHIGTIEIGQVTGKSLITPLDFTTQQFTTDQFTTDQFTLDQFTLDQEDIKLTNILQLLQTLDDDGDASNGINIAENVRLAAADLVLSVSIDDESFVENQELLTFIGSVSNTSNFISAEQALNHFMETLVGLE